MTVQRHVILAGDAGCLGQGFPFGDQDLGADDINACHLFGDGVLDLHAGVHLDEVEFAAVHIHQEFDGAGAFVVHMLADLLSEVAELFTLGLRKVGSGRALHDLLVAALNGAVTFPQVVDVALLITKDLHLDVTGADDHLFEITFAVAESGFGLAAAFANFVGQFRLGLDRAHASAAAAPAGLEHQGVADFGGFFADRIHIVAQHLGRGDDRNAGGDGDATGGGFVAQLAHGFGFGTDKGDAVLFAGIHKIGVFGQEAITGVDGIGARHFGNADDLVDTEIGGYGTEALANAVGFVCFEAVEAEFVLFGKDSNGLFAHLVGCTHDADGDLATVCDENLLKIGHEPPPSSQLQHYQYGLSASQ